MLMFLETGSRLTFSSCFSSDLFYILTLFVAFVPKLCRFIVFSNFYRYFLVRFTVLTTSLIYLFKYILFSCSYTTSYVLSVFSSGIQELHLACPCGCRLGDRTTPWLSGFGVGPCLSWSDGPCGGAFCATSWCGWLPGIMCLYLVSQCQRMYVLSQSRAR